MRVCCVLVLVAVGCAAQENTPSISGTVIDHSGATIPNATVTLSSSTTVEAKTDSHVGQALPDKVPSECSASICGAIRYGSASVANAIVTLHLSGESHRVKTTRTDPNGIFQLGEVKPGLYDLTIKAKGWEIATIDSIGLQRGGQVTLPLVQLQRPTTTVR
jgi:hypothetical protein